MQVIVYIYLPTYYQHLPLLVIIYIIITHFFPLCTTPHFSRFHHYCNAQERTPRQNKTF